MEEKKRFCDDLKPGDKLARESGYSFTRYTEVTVKHITPTGKIVLTNGLRFDENGREIIKSGFQRDHLRRWTPELRARIQQQENISYINRVQWREVDNETLAEVVKLLKSREGTEGK